MTAWIRLVEAGDPEGAERLWGRYSRRLLRMARAQLGASRRVFADEDDVALDAFHSLLRGVRGGRFPDLGSRDNLWRLLVAIALRKAADLRCHEQRLKRAAPSQVVPLADLEEDVAAMEPTPELAAQVAETCSRLLAALGDEGLATIALWRMEGYTNDEIAERLGCARRTVERKLELIRHTWRQAGES